VIVIGVFLSLPNVFGEESALQLAPPGGPSPMPRHAAVVHLLNEKGVTPGSEFF